MKDMVRQSLSRRGVIKGASAVAAAVLGPDAITGFPAVHSQAPGAAAAPEITSEVRGGA